MARKKRFANPDSIDYITARLSRAVWGRAQEAGRWYGVSPSTVVNGTFDRGLAWWALAHDLAGGAYHDVPELESEAAHLIQLELALRLKLNRWCLKMPGGAEELRRLGKLPPAEAEAPGPPKKVGKVASRALVDA